MGRFAARIILRVRPDGKYSTTWKSFVPASRRPNDETSERSLVGLAEVAQILGVTKRTATSYAQRPDFPEPLKRLAATPVWLSEDVAAWAEQTLPLTRGRPPEDRA
jgi:predicted DNA-binding transcriptional regulator AlpA